jgi:hypothetical protein
VPPLKVDLTAAAASIYCRKSTSAGCWMASFQEALDTGTVADRRALFRIVLDAVKVERRDDG